MRLLDILQKNKKAIIQSETAALLHDLDKLDPAFLEDPYSHTKTAPVKTERWQNLVGQDAEISLTGIDCNALAVADNDVSLTADTFGSISSPFIFHHDNRRETIYSPLAIIVHGGGSGADGIDSALDKINTQNDDNEQKVPFVIDSPFGIQARTWENRMDEAEKLLRSIDFADFDRKKLFSKLRSLFETALGETRYPCNDVTLWAHSFSVATLTKSLLAKVLIEYEQGTFSPNVQYLLPRRLPRGKSYIDPAENPTDFTLIKITFDRDYALRTAQKTGDITGIVDQIETIQDELRQFYEEELLVGNQTYRDEQQQLFLLPRLGTWKKNNNEVFPGLQQDFEQELAVQIESRIVKLLEEFDCPELAFSIDFTESANLKPPLESDRILVRTRTLLLQEARCSQSVSSLLAITQSDGKGRCEVCSIRSIANSGKARDERICTSCHTRRHKRKITAQRSVYYEHTTANLESLTESENKLMLLTVFFDLTFLWDGSLFDNVKINENQRKNTSPGRLCRSYETLNNFLAEFRREVAGVCPKGIFPVTQSPTRLELVASSIHADGILSLLQQKYEKNFGKVRSFLPLSAGIIFFYRKFPLYVVLEAANRMRTHLCSRKTSWTVADAQHTEYLSLLTLEQENALDSSGIAAPVTWPVSCTRSDAKLDTFYPRLVTKGAPQGIEVQKIQSKNKITSHEGCFDFLLMDSAVRRFAITPDGLQHHMGGKRQAYLFSGWENFVRLYGLLAKLKQNQISNIETILVEKQQAWGPLWQPADPVTKQFCHTAIMAPNAFGKRKRDGTWLLLDEKSNLDPLPFESDKALLINAAANGFLLDVIDFYIHILKQS